MTQLDYETSVDRGQRRRIIEMLRRGAGFTWGGVGLRLVCGIGLTLLMSSIMAGLLGTVICRFVGWIHADYIYNSCFLVVLAWSLWRGCIGGANPMADELRDYGSGVGSVQSYGEFEMRSLTASVWAWWEVLISGPKLIVEAVATWRGRQSSMVVDMDRTAETVLDLYRAGQGIRVDELLHAGDSREGMCRILAYLHWQDWVDFSKDRQRVWLSSRLVPTLRDLLKTPVRSGQAK